MKYIGYIMFALFCTTFTGFGGYQVWNQYHMNVAYQPVEAVVLGKKVIRKVSRDSDGNETITYEPVVNYKYKLGKAFFQGSSVTPLDESSNSRSWAANMIKPYKRGQTVVAFYNPEAPRQSYLRKFYSFTPYLFYLIGLIMFLGMILVGAKGADLHNPPRPGIVGNGWFTLEPMSSILRRRRLSLIAAIVLLLGGGVVCSHYFIVVENYSTMSYVFGGIFGLVMALAVGMLIYYTILEKTVSEPLVRTNTMTFHRGDKIEFHFRQKFLDDCKLLSLVIRLVGQKTVITKSGDSTKTTTTIDFEEEATLVENRDMDVKTWIDVEAPFFLPTDANPTSDKSVSSPRYDWYFEVKGAIDDRPDFRSKYPIVLK